MPGRSLVRALALTAGAALIASSAATTASADSVRSKPKPLPDATTSIGPPVDLGVLFVGAHPDDEAGTLSTFGQWGQHDGVKTGVVTITRGEGGGNAVGTEEGPALGLLREEEERRAVGKAGITDIFNLDDVDFYYTVSQPLTRQTWGHDDVLGKLVRVIRTTRPEVLVTMNPSPTPGQHGNHQEAARLTAEAYYAAADPTRFPEQIRKEGLKPFAPARLLFRASWGTAGPNGAGCTNTFKPTDATQKVYGAWGGTSAPDGRTWAAVERSAQREYASQGWAGFPDVPADSAQLGCDYFTVADSRTPIAAAGSAGAAANNGALVGALVREAGGLPLGTGVRVTTSAYRVLAGQEVTVGVQVTAPAGGLTNAKVTFSAPDGWTAPAPVTIGSLGAGQGRTVEAKITVPAGATPSATFAVGATLTSDQGTGYNDHSLRVVPGIEVRQQAQPAVEEYRTWAPTVNLDEFADIAAAIATVPVQPNANGQSFHRKVNYVVTNHTAAKVDYTLSVEVPAGFFVWPNGHKVWPVNPGQTVIADLTWSITDPATVTSAPGGDRVSKIGSGPEATTGILEAVPGTDVAQAAAAPTIDGKETAGEYPGPELDISRLWEGSACTSAADCAGTAKVTWRDDTLYLLVNVKDDVKGTALATADCKRHWRTDSVEIAIDPSGSSENTSTTFKAAVLPFTAEGPACSLRDADNHQGDASTAPGMKVAATVDEPYTGYTVEVAIPLSLLPGAVSQVAGADGTTWSQIGLNILPYDSDTQDKTGQTRIGWSVWNGVQGDPYRWGVARLVGYTPPAGRPTTAPAPVMPLEFLDSLDSPQTIEQAIRNNVAMAGYAASPAGLSGWVDKARVRKGAVDVRIRANGVGTAHIFVRDAKGTAGSLTVKVGAGRTTYAVPLTRALSGTASVIVGWKDVAGGNVASTLPVK